MERNQVIVSDILAAAASLEPGCVQAICTSPPYWGLRLYPVPPTAWPAIDYAPMPGLPPVAVPAQTVCLGQETSPLDFIGHLVQVFRALRHALHPSGTLWLNLGDSYVTRPNGSIGASTLEGSHAPHVAYRATNGLRSAGVPGALSHKNLCGIPWRAAFALQADGWILRSDCIWSKPNVMPSSVTDRPTTAHEYVFLFSKQPRYYFDATAIAEPCAAGDRGSTYTNGKTGAVHDSRGQGARTDKQAASGLRTYAGFNERWEASPTTTRNKRTIWEIPSYPYPGAHFSAWPPDLVRPMVRAGSSDHGACSACGSPYRRVTGDAPAYAALKAERGRWGHDAGDEAVEFGRRQRGTNGAASGSELAKLGARQQTTGWQPTCRCEGAGIIPCTILDPFMGSGTTAQVAVEEGRDWLGIDADPRAVGWAEERLAGLCVGRLPGV